MVSKKGNHIFIARVFLSLIFIVGGFGFLTNFSGTVGMIESFGLPFAALLAIIGIVLKLGGGLMLLLGWKVKEASYALILFTVVATLLAHLNFSDQNQMTQFLKNLAIVGGLVLMSKAGPGAFSLDKK